MPRRRRSVRVRVVRRADKPGLVLRWTDPATGRTRERATGTRVRREAERQAALLIAQMEEGELIETVTWRLFRQRYESEHMALRRPKTAEAWRTAANMLEEGCRPTYLTDIDAGMLSLFSAKLREGKIFVPDPKHPEPRRSQATVASYLRHLRAGLNWAANIFPGYRRPAITMPRIPKSEIMRGRPITAEEFERMLLKTGEVVGPKRAKGWWFFLRGLFLSGLRLDEALHLTWDRPDALHVWNLDNRRPMLRIHAAGEKGNRDRLLPITPDFAALLRGVPPASRTGFVFNPRMANGRIKSVNTASKIVSAIGEAAMVVVDERDGQKQHATAHDLRRSFGERWARRVMPIVLKELMRHDSIETTMKFYVGENAERTANEVWRAFGDLGGDPAEPRPDHEDIESS